MIYEILNASGAVINRISADQDFVQANYPGRYRLESAGDAGQAPQPQVDVPLSVPMLNAHLALIADGKMQLLLDLVAQLPDTDRMEVQAYLNLAQSCRRDNKWVVQLGPSLGYDSAGLDQLFIAAAALNP